MPSEIAPVAALYTEARAIDRSRGPGRAGPGRAPGEARRTSRGVARARGRRRAHIMTQRPTLITRKSQTSCGRASSPRPAGLSVGGILSASSSSQYVPSLPLMTRSAGAQPLRAQASARRARPSPKSSATDAQQATALASPRARPPPPLEVLISRRLSSQVPRPPGPLDPRSSRARRARRARAGASDCSNGLCPWLTARARAPRRAARSAVCGPLRRGGLGWSPRRPSGVFGDP